MWSPLNERKQKLVADQRKTEAARDTAEREWEEARDAIEDKWEMWDESKRERKKESLKQLFTIYQENKAL